jgi:ABC-type protease/lipase transport system fused ATPase/permease subunit
MKINCVVIEILNIKHYSFSLKLKMIFEIYEIIIFAILIFFSLTVAIIAIYMFCKKNIEVKKSRALKKKKKLEKTPKFIYYSSTSSSSSSSNTEDEMEIVHDFQDAQFSLNNKNNFKFFDHTYDPYFTSL